MRFRFALTLACVWCFFSPVYLQADCGITWGTPKAHFDRLDEKGNVMLVEKCGYLELKTESGDSSIPIYALFMSDSASRSPYLGYGWQIPLLESRVYAVGDREFRVIQPNGWARTFTRDGRQPAILNGQGGWRGEIKGDRIELSAECGSRLLYEKGRIVEMYTDGATLRYIYSNASLTEIQRDGQTVLKVVRAPGTDSVTGLALPDGKEILFSATERPVVEAVAGTKVVSRVEPAVGQIAASTRTVTFEYGVDEQMNPTIKSDSRLITWNPANGDVMQDGADKYVIHPPAQQGVNPAITRIRANGSEEFYQTGAGFDLVRTKEFETKRTWFTTGLVENRPRSFTVKDLATGLLKTEVKYTYDEKSRLVRKTHLNDKVENFVYDGKRLAGKTISKKGQLFSEETFDKEGRRQVLTIKGKVREMRHYPVNGTWETKLQPILTLVGKYIDAAQIAEIKVANDLQGKPTYQLFGPKSTSLAFVDSLGNVSHKGTIEDAQYVNGAVRKFVTKSAEGVPTKIESYDEKGKLASTQTIDMPDRYTRLTKIKTSSGKENYVLLRFDEKGRTIEHSSKKGAYKYSYLPDGTRNQTFIPYPKESGK